MKSLWGLCEFMIVVQTTDRIPVKIQDVEFIVAPLSYDQKKKMSAAFKQESGESVLGMLDLTYSALKFSIKSVRGLEKMDGSEYKLTFDDDGNLSDESVSDLMNIPIKEELFAVCAHLANGMKGDFKVDGVQLQFKHKQKQKIKKK